MVKKLIVACCDDEVRNIVVVNGSAIFGENQISICKSWLEMYEMIRYAEDTAVIFDKYFLGYVLTYPLLRMKILNEAILPYFVEIGECSIYFALRIYELGSNGFIPCIERKDVFKNNFLKIKEGRKTFPESVMRSIEDDDYLLDRKCITEVTASEMAIGMYIGMGKSQKEICYITGLSKQTVSLHTHRLKRKIGYKRPTDYNLLDMQYWKHKGGLFDC